MTPEQLLIAQNDWSHSMEITLIRGRIYVANDGYITEDPADVKQGKHAGEYGGFYYSSKRKGNQGSLIGVIRSIMEG